MADCSKKKVDKTAIFLVIGMLFLLLFVAVLLNMLKDIYNQQQELIDLQEQLMSSSGQTEVVAEPEASQPVALGNPVVEKEQIVAETELYTCVARREARCYSEPDTASALIKKYSSADKVEVISLEGNFYKVKADDYTLGYVEKRYLSQGGALVNVPNAVDLRAYLPNAEYEMLFASPYNITGHAMYPAVPILEESTAEMLMEAYEIFDRDGYIIKIYDAYRPKSAQIELWEIVRNSAYIANPNTGGSWHQRGRAVDMSLVNKETGEELEMPTPMHTFDPKAGRYKSSLWSAEAKANSDYMTEVMTSVGFKTITTEWWHFENTKSGNMLPNDIDLGSAEYR